MSNEASFLFNTESHKEETAEEYINGLTLQLTCPGCGYVNSGEWIVKTPKPTPAKGIAKKQKEKQQAKKKKKTKGEIVKLPKRTKKRKKKK